MIRGTLSCGFAYEITDDALNNMELVDAIAEMGEDPVSMSRVVRLLLGDQQRKALYDHLREGGTVRIEAVADAVAEIFRGSNQVKN